MSAARQRIAAVILREMRALARYRTPFVLRTVYGLLIAAPVAIFVAGIGGQRWSGEQLAFFGFQSFTVLVWWQSFLALALGILIAVVSVATERRERTLGLVMLSQVRPVELVLGKLMALSALLSTVLLTGLPVYALIGWAGGVDYFWFAGMVLLTAALAVLGLAAGLAAGLAVHNAFAAVLGAASLVFVPMILGVILQESAAGPAQGPLNRIPASVLWLTATVAEQGSDDRGATAVDVVVVSAMIAGLLLYAVHVLPQAAPAREGAGLRGAFERLDRFYEGINFGGIRLGRERRALSGDPVSWLTRTTSGTASMRYGLRLGTVVVVGSLMSVPGLFFDDGRALVWVLFGGGLMVAMVALGAGGLGDEKARRSLDVLLATPLTAGQILHGKMRATLPLVLVMALAPAGCFLGFVRLADPGLVGDIGLGIAWLLAEGLCGYFLALSLSLHLTSTLRAGVAAALALAAVHAVFGLSAAWAEKHVAAMILWSLGAVAAAVWAGFNGQPAVRFAALLAALAGGAGALWQWLQQLSLTAMKETFFPVFFGLLALVSGLSYVHARGVFDRVLGRSP